MIQKDNLKQIVGSSPVVAFIWKIQQGWPVEFVSDGIRQFGFTPEEFLSGELIYNDIIHQEDKKRVAEEVANYITLKKMDYEQSYRILTKNGQVRWVYDWTHLTFDEMGQAIKCHGFILDITSSVLLQRSHSQLINTTENMFLAHDGDGYVIAVNDRTCQVVGVDKDQIIGMNWIKEFVPESEQFEIQYEVDRTVSSKDKGEVRTYENIIVARDGKSHLIRWSYSNEYTPDGEVERVIAFGVDVTEQHEVSTRLQDITDNMPGAVFQYTIDKDGHDDIDYMSSGCEAIWELDSKTLERDPGPLWAMVLDSDLPAMQKSVLKSAENLSRWEHEWRIVTKSGKQKWLRGIGTPRRLTTGGTRWHSLVVDITEQRKGAESVSQAMRKVIYVLSAALEKRDPYTAGHEERVSEISVMIGKKLGLDENRLIGLELGAMVHDVGKISIPAEILSKPTKLLDVEYELIKLHPSTGAELVQDMDFEWPIAEMILQHHERCDGSGYPNGLKGDEILLEAKILAVADTIEAMASHRPYRPGLGLEQAAAEVEAGSGTRYDPDVVTACLELIENGELIV